MPLDQDINEAIFRLHFGATLPFPACRTRSPEIFLACGERWRARLPCRNAVWIAAQRRLTWAADHRNAAGSRSRARVFEKLSAVRIIDGLRLSGQVYARRARAVAAHDEVVEGLGKIVLPATLVVGDHAHPRRLLAKSASVNVCLRRFTCTRRSHPPFLTSASATSRGCRCSPGPCVRMRVVDVPASDADVTQ